MENWCDTTFSPGLGEIVPFISTSLSPNTGDLCNMWFLPLQMWFEADHIAIWSRSIPVFQIVGRLCYYIIMMRSIEGKAYNVDAKFWEFVSPTFAAWLHLPCFSACYLFFLPWTLCKYKQDGTPFVDIWIPLILTSFTRSLLMQGGGSMTRGRGGVKPKGLKKFCIFTHDAYFLTWVTVLWPFLPQ